MANSVEGKGHKLVIDALLPRLVSPRTLAQRPDVCARVVDLIEEAQLAAIAGAQRGMAERPDSTQLACELDLPVLAVVGEHDAISKREELEALTGRMRDATLAVIPDAGHMTVFENTTATNRALGEFINELR
jgi:pimeloyl-ACP methyl ester carboxylesterase